MNKGIALYSKAITVCIELWGGLWNGLKIAKRLKSGVNFSKKRGGGE